MTSSVATFKQSLRGVWAAIPIPRQESGALDTGLFTEIVHRYKSEGVHGVYTTGTDGEMHEFEYDEFCHMTGVFAKAAKAAGIPAQSGCTWVNGEGSIKRAMYARDQGLSCVQVALPFWVTLKDQEILRYFERLAEICPDVGIVHYNTAATGRFLTGRDYQLIESVAPNLVGSKHTGGNVSSISEIVESTPELHHFVVDTQILPGVLLGAKGFYSFLVNLNPRFAVQMWDDCERGDWKELGRKRRLVDGLFREWAGYISLASPAIVKIGARLGIAPEIRLGIPHPYISGTEDQVVALRTLMQDRFSELIYTK